MREFHCTTTSLKTKALIFWHMPDLGSPAGCPDTDFQCVDGSCIKAVLRCDGVAHCRDGSDEDISHGTLSFRARIILIKHVNVKFISARGMFGQLRRKCGEFPPHALQPTNRLSLSDASFQQFTYSSVCTLASNALIAFINAFVAKTCS